MRVYFASDCDETKETYENDYKNRCIDEIEMNDDIEHTYVDLYMMSRSKNIILSQRHSSFSLFASMMTGTNLIYLYNDSIICKNGYNTFDNMIFYEEIM